MAAAQCGASAGMALVAGCVWDSLAVVLYLGLQYWPSAKFPCSMTVVCKIASSLMCLVPNLERLQQRGDGWQLALRMMSLCFLPAWQAQSSQASYIITRFPKEAHLLIFNVILLCGTSAFL